MEIRQLKAEEFEQHMELSSYAFQYKLNAEEIEQSRQLFKPERVWGVFEDGVLQAQLKLIPFQTYIQQQSMEMGGIAGVATWPENRRQGLVDQLLRHALQLMKQQGQSVSFLHPFYFPFYRKYGWELYTEYMQYTIPTALLPAKVQTDGYIKRGVRDLELLHSIYGQYASQYNGTLVRDIERWTNATLRSDDTRTAVYYANDGQAQGYILYTVLDKEMNISEIAYTTEEARRGLWTYISNHDSMVQHVKLKAPLDDGLPYLLQDPRIEQQKVPYFMARIVDVKAFLEQYPFEHGTTGQLTIEISDRVAEWNAGVWQIVWDADGHATVKQMESDEDVAQSANDVQVKADIRVWTAMLMGYKRPSELSRWEQLDGDEQAIQLLEKLIPRRGTHLMDFF
ncbi:GNAT family N-acetyltransferase [Paenibacillus wenxiniae]|uniref:Enhanced intracellular survival protein Eis n=1 Tax=Paenibacillus wenxiniae TaxID=1636843 RepID=A0ABW4RKK1_9BACL